MPENVGAGASLNGDALAQLAELFEDSPKFRRDIDRLSRLAAGTEKDGYSLSTGPLQRYSWQALAEKRTRHKHVRVYLAGCEELAHQCFRLPHLWPHVHRLVGARLEDATTYRVDLPRLPSAPPAWVGPVASKMAAHVTGDASFGTGTVPNRQAFQRQVGPMASAWLAALYGEREARRDFIL